jgi:hypothetical protein
MVYISTSRAHPGYKQRLAQFMNAPPYDLPTASIQVAMFAQGLVPDDAFPVPPHCIECATRRKRGMPPVVEPNDISLNVVYNTSNTNTIASAPGAVATSQANTAAAGSTITAPSPVYAPPGAPAYPPQPQPSYAAPPQYAPAPAPAPQPPPMFGGFPGMFGFGFPMPPAPVFAAASAPAPAYYGQSVGAPSNVNNSGNVNLLLIGEGGEELLGGGGDDGAAAGDFGGIDPTAGMMAGGAGGMLAALGLSTSGPEGDESLVTGGEDDELSTGGADMFGFGDDDAGVPALEDLLVTGGGDDAGTLLGVDPGGDQESFVDLGDEECETGSCGLF